MYELAGQWILASQEGIFPLPFVGKFNRANEHLLSVFVWFRIFLMGELLVRHVQEHLICGGSLLNRQSVEYLSWVVCHLVAYWLTRSAAVCPVRVKSIDPENGAVLRAQLSTVVQRSGQTADALRPAWNPRYVRIMRTAYLAITSSDVTSSRPSA